MDLEAVVAGVFAGIIGLLLVVVRFWRELNGITLDDDDEKTAPSSNGVSISSGNNTSIGGDVTAGDKHGGNTIEQ